MVYSFLITGTSSGLGYELAKNLLLNKHKVIGVSRTLGKSPWHTFWNITIPLTWTGLTTGIALSWARSLSEFGATLMFAGNMIGETQTMPLGIMTAMETDLNTALNLSLVLLMISVIILLGIHFLSSKFSRTRV